MTKEHIKNTIKQHKNVLSGYGIKSLSLFGSYIRGEENEKSDIDLLVEFNKTIDLFNFIGLENYLSDICGRKVDLVMKSSLKPRIKDQILKEAVAL